MLFGQWFSIVLDFGVRELILLIASTMYRLIVGKLVKGNKTEYNDSSSLC